MGANSFIEFEAQEVNDDNEVIMVSDDELVPDENNEVCDNFH